MTDARHSFDIALGRAATPDAALAALHALAEALFGAKLFTLTTVEIEKGMARRLYSSDPVAYPVSGTKPMVRDDWYVFVCEDHQTFVVQTLAEMAKVFPDHALIDQLGCGSCVNFPVIRAGKVIATVNLLDVENFWTDRRLAQVQSDLILPAMAAFATFHNLGGV